MDVRLQDWTNRLGVLPVNFSHNQGGREERYAMLNGLTNNFCIAFEREVDEERRRSQTWSADMSNYIAIDDGVLRLYNIKSIRPEEIPYNFVLDNLTMFYQYLATKQIGTQDSIVPFIMRQFRMVRNSLREIESAADGKNRAS